VILLTNQLAQLINRTEIEVAEIKSALNVALAFGRSVVQIRSQHIAELERCEQNTAVAATA